MQKRFFTVEEARRLLPEIKEVIAKIVSLSDRLEKHREAIQALADAADTNTGSPEGTFYLENLLLLQNYIRNIQGIGCIVKNIQEGLLDFPHIKDGREVYLCWKYGEDDIRHWHEVEEGFAGRTPLLE